MTRQEELREQYEDALFTLLMEEVAVAEGEEFLRESEALRGDPEAAVPEEVIRRCRRTINRCFSRQRRRSLARQFRWVFQKASVVALLGVLLFSAVYAISPEFRVGVLNLVVETLDESTDVSFVGPDDTTSERQLQIVTDWIPDGFYVTEEGQEGNLAWVYFLDNYGNEIKIDAVRSTGQVTSWDTQDTSTIPVSMNGMEGAIIYKNDQLSLTLIDTTESITLTIRAKGINMEDLIAIGENTYCSFVEN